MNSTVIGTTDERSSSSNLNGLIGFATVTSEAISTSASVVITRDKYGRTAIRSINNSRVQCRSPNGMISIELVDNHGIQVPTQKNYTGYSTPSSRAQTTITINNVIVVVEVKQVNPLLETMNQIKSRRSYQIP